MNLDVVALLMLAGWIAGLMLKYVVFGLETWDNALHPERLAADLNGSYRKFRYPLLGVFHATCS